MAEAYLRIEGLDPEELDEADRNLFGELANGVFNQLREDAPELFEQHKGVIPVRNPEHDPRLLETTAVFAHRDATVDDGVSDFVFCSFGDDAVEDLDVPRYASVEEFAEVELMQAFDDGYRERLDDLLPTESEREEAGEEPVRVGTLYHDSEVVFRVDFDADVFEDDDTESAGTHGVVTGP